VEGDAVFKTDFLRNRREIKGASLKDFDLRSRLFKYRCSYMVYSTVFAGLPPLMKERIYRRLGAACRAVSGRAGAAGTSVGAAGRERPELLAHDGLVLAARDKTE